MKMKRQSLFYGLILLCVCMSAASAQSCRSYNFTGNQEFEACVDHPVLNSFLHWTYFPSNTTLRVAFRRPSTSSSTWAAWAINSSGPRMTGAQALVAFPSSNGAPRVYTSNVVGYDTRLQESALSFPVPELTATYVNNEMIIFATLRLTDGGTTINQVWQEGPVSGGSLLSHAFTGDNRMSVNTLDLLSGAVGP